MSIGLQPPQGKLKLLPEYASGLIKSQVEISSFAFCVAEVVKNSIDARASRVVITLDTKQLSFDVQDNGEGIFPVDLNYVGKSGYTSKLVSETREDNWVLFGFKGQSLNSISSQSIVAIQSKSKAYDKTMAVRLALGSHSKPYISPNPMTGNGTIVSCRSLFSNFPVRQKHALSISEYTHTEQLKKLLLPIIISHPNISVTIYGLSNNRLFYYFGKPDSVNSHIDIITTFHDSYLLNQWNTITARSKETTICATFSTRPLVSKAFQYIGMKTSTSTSLLC